MTLNVIAKATLMERSSALWPRRAVPAAARPVRRAGSGTDSQSTQDIRELQGLTADECTVSNQVIFSLLIYKAVYKACGVEGLLGVRDYQ